MDLKPISVVMMGASGAVGGHVVQTLLHQQNIQKLTLLGRNPIPNLSDNAPTVEHHQIDILEVGSYSAFLPNHNVAICTLGVGEPSKISKEEFLKIDKEAVIEFAKASKKAGVEHFELLASVGIDPKSRSFYLRTKGELVAALKALNFGRLSIFQPSMILTPTNRYGISQAIVLKVWPLFKPLLMGGLRKYRGIPVNDMGKAMALNILKEQKGFEILQWDDFYAIIK